MSHVHPTAIQIYPWKKITGSNVDLTPPTFFSRNNRIIRGNYVQCSHTGVIRNRTMLSIILDDWDEIDIRSIQPHFWNNLFGTSTTSFFQTLDQWKKKWTWIQFSMKFFYSFFRARKGWIFENKSFLLHFAFEKRRIEFFVSTGIFFSWKVNRFRK